MTIDTAIQALANIAPRLSLRDRARVRAEQPITSTLTQRTQADHLRPPSLAHSQPYVTRFGPQVTALRQWVDRALAGPIGEMPCESERAAAAEWLMEPYVEYREVRRR